jgi:acetylornithine/succinyldiaminopimelate/putrescine aminotransferase
VLQKQTVQYSKLSDADAAEIMAMDEKYILPLYGRGNFVFTHGEGAYLYTHDNKKFMDCFSGVAVMSLGHSDPEWVAAVQDQVGKLVSLQPSLHNCSVERELSR